MGAESKPRDAADNARASARDLTGLRDAARAMAIEESRARAQFASLLHDGPTQNLAAACMYMAALQADDENADLKVEYTDKVLELIAASLATLRQIMTELSPPDLFTDGLPSALNWLGMRYEKSSAQRCTIQLAHDLPTFAEPQVAAIFQITRALLHHHEHSHAHTDVTVTIDSTATQVDVTLGSDQHYAAGPAMTSVQERVKLFGGQLSVCDLEPSRLRVALPLE